ncbi:hypothetical protein [Planctomycetes bacterium K23_9]|uniref:Pseudopilin GspJ n=1 Tax=Stieleria marina TaxID=1930275 RepID=A0A517P2K2_9BACT|nr:hypothetical protein K239x_56210 [Planctomycetes bacterium K23_9]
MSTLFPRGIDRDRSTARAHRIDRAGLSLIEVAVSLILVSTILLVSITASANLMRNSNASQSALRAHELAGILLDEISTRALSDGDSDAVFGVESDEDAANRQTFDDVDDYSGYTQTSPTYLNGQSIDGFDTWTIQINVSPAITTASGITTTNDPDDPLRLVTVVCSSPGHQQTGMPLVTRQSILLSAAGDSHPADLSYEKSRQLELTFSPDRKITVVSPLRNHPSPTTN